jgi:hypothetical protein
VAWASNRQGGNPEIYCKSFDGVDWSATTRLTYDDSSDYHPAITRVDNGDLWIVWCSDRNGEPEIYRKTYDGMSWSADLRLGSCGESPSITRTGEGQTWIAYTRDSDIFYRLHEDADWSDESVLPTGPAANSWSSVTRDSLGRICIAFSSPRQANEDIYLQRTCCTVTSGIGEEPPADVPPGRFFLVSSPNPFSGGTALQFILPSSGHVEVAVYDVHGERTATLFDGWKAAGPHKVGWDGRNSEGAKVSCGVYFCMLTHGGSTVSRKTVHIR